MPVSGERLACEAVRRPPVAATLLAGAVVLAVLRGALGASFDVTPLVVGLTALAATAAGTSRRRWAAPAAVTAWGLAVLLVRGAGLLGGREAPVFLVAVGAGLLLGGVATDERERGPALLSGAGVVAAGGLLFLLSYDVAALRAWPLWSAGLAAAAAREAVMRRP